jgi:hypothetical protein
MEGGPSWSGVIVDSNHPDDQHWIHEKAEVERPEGMEFFRQPGALIRSKDRDGTTKYLPNPLAENITNLPKGYQYYYDMLPGKEEDAIKVFLLSQYGSLFTGCPVYADWWDERFHVSKEPLRVYRGLPLYFGWDYGLTPAGPMAQVTPQGQIRVLREFVCKRGDIEGYLDTEVVPALAREFPGMVNRRGFRCVSAPTNDPERRWSAVIRALRRTVRGEAGFVVDPSCRVLIRGFNGGYRYSRIRSTDGGEKVRDIADKNEYSHVHDGLQYLVLGLTTPEGAVAPESRDVVLERPKQGWEGAA